MKPSSCCLTNVIFFTSSLSLSRQVLSFRGTSEAIFQSGSRRYHLLAELVIAQGVIFSPSSPLVSRDFSMTLINALVVPSPSIEPSNQRLKSFLSRSDPKIRTERLHSNDYSRLEHTACPRISATLFKKNI